MWGSREIFANNRQKTGFSWENMGNHANNEILFCGPMIFSEICPEKPLFSGLGEGGCVNFVCRGEEIENFPEF